MLVHRRFIALASIIGLLLATCFPSGTSAQTVPPQGETRIAMEEIRAEIQGLQNKKVRVLLITGELLEGTVLGVGDSTFWLGSGQLSREIAFSDVEAIKKLEGGLSKATIGLLVTGIGLVTFFLALSIGIVG